MIAALRKEGFDGAILSRSEAVSAPDDRPELDPEVAKTVLAQMIILPCYEGMPADELAREAKTVIGKISQKINLPQEKVNPLSRKQATA